MKALFVHQNFPGQYQHLARHLAKDPANQVVFITQRKDNTNNASANWRRRAGN